jgi:hypothetical protein
MATWFGNIGRNKRILFQLSAFTEITKIIPCVYLWEKLGYVILVY